MAVSGLILTLCPDQQLREEALHALSDDRRISVGVQQQHRLPIVVDSASREEDREVWDRLQQMPGVVFVDVVCVHEDDSALPEDAGMNAATDHSTREPTNED